MRIDLSNLRSLVDNYYRQNPEAAASSGYTPVAPPVATPRPVAPPVATPRPVAPPVVAPAPVAPKPAPVEYTSLNNPFLEYRDTLSGGANYANINDVDSVDDYYDTAFEKAFSDTGYLTDIDIIGGEGGVGGGQVDYSPTRILSEQEYRGFVGDAPAYLSDFGEATSLAKTQQAYSSIKNLTSTDDLASALSSYYGYDVTPNEQSFSKADFGGNLGQHTNSSGSELQQFHSLVEPILKEQVSYLQATKGLDYQTALMTAYQSDPMLQSLYHKYDIKPFRQTKDGSTYLYDPFSFSEIRTFESKDPSELQIAAQIGAAVLGSFVLGPAAQATIGSMVATTTGSLALGATAANMATQAAIATAMGGDPLEAALMGGIPVGNIPIPFTGGQTLTGLTGGNVDFLLGAPDPVSVALRASLAGAASTIPGSGTFTGATPDFNPYINNIAAATSGTTVEAEEEQYNIDLANLAALSQPEEAPVTPVTQPEFDDITVDTTVESGELPELEEDIAPPPPPPSTSDGGGGGEEEAGLDVIAAQLREAIAREEDPDVKAGLSLELEKWMSSGPPEYERMATGPKPSDYEGDNEEEQALLWIAALANSYGTGTGNDIAGDSGSGSGTGDGTGDGSGGGAGGGLGAGMLGGAAAGGKPSVTELVFSDYTKRYEAPELQKRVLPLQGYQAPQGLFRGLV